MNAHVTIKSKQTKIYNETAKASDVATKNADGLVSVEQSSLAKLADTVLSFNNVTETV